MKVRDLMQRDVQTIHPDATVAELVQTLADQHISGLPVTEGGQLIGVVSSTDVLQAAAEKEDEEARDTLFEHTLVREIMSPNPHVITPDADVREAARNMLYADVKRLFVLDDGELVGVISQTDIAHAVGTGRLRAVARS
jgi:CBS domain-containing protein